MDSSTVFLLNAGNAKISVQQSIMLADSGVFISGSIREAALTDTAFFITRLDKFNNIIFSKKLVGFKGYSRKLLRCSNGDILVAATAINQSLVITIYLFRFTVNGALVWQKRLPEMISNWFSTGVADLDLTEADNDDLYAGFSDDIETNAALGNTSSYYNIYRISSGGNIIWKTTLIQNESILSHINAIKVVNGEVLIVTQQYYYGANSCVSSNSRSIGLIKLNQVTGTHISTKYYCLKINSINCYGAQDNVRHSVKFLTNGKILISGSIFTCDSHPAFTIETDYNFSNPGCYTYLYNVPYTISIGRVTANEFGEVSLFARGYSGLHFLYATFLPDGTITMQRKMELPTGQNLSTGSVSPVFKKPDVFLFFVNENQNNQEYLKVIEFKGNINGTSDCTGKDTTFVTSQPHTIVPIPRNWDTIRYEAPLIFNTNFSLSDFSFQREEVCSSISICDSLKIIGTDTICLNNPAQQFTAYRNPGCLKVPQWKIDTSAILSMQTVNDSTVSITFKRSWQGYLYAYSSSCNRLSDSLYIKVVPAALPVQLGRDTTYCNPVVLDAGDNYVSYEWQDGSSDRYFNVDTGGIYYVSVRDFCGNIFSDTIRFSIPPTNLFIGNDTCVQQFPFLISANPGFKNYQWQNGTNNSQFNAAAPGLYYVNATNGCNNVYADSILINRAVKPFSLGKDTTLCGQQQITLSAPQGYTAYLWQNNSTGNNIVVIDTGYFFVRVTDYCGNNFADTIKINPLNLFFSAGKDTVAICKEESVRLSAGTGYTNYLWKPDYNITDANKREVWVKPEISTKYFATAEKGPGCTVSDSVFVLVKNCPTNFFVPSAFTPNKDGLNDFFGPIATAPLQHYEFWIFNRWGQQIFYSNDIQKKWDGKVNSSEQNAGVFVWRCVYKFFNGPELSKKGSFVLIR